MLPLPTSTPNGAHRDSKHPIESTCCREDVGTRHLAHTRLKVRSHRGAQIAMGRRRPLES